MAGLGHTKQPPDPFALTNCHALFLDQIVAAFVALACRVSHDFAQDPAIPVWRCSRVFTRHEPPERPPRSTGRADVRHRNRVPPRRWCAPVEINQQGFKARRHIGASAFGFQPGQIGFDEPVQAVLRRGKLGLRGFKLPARNVAGRNRALGPGRVSDWIGRSVLPGGTLPRLVLVTTLHPAFAKPANATPVQPLFFLGLLPDVRIHPNCQIVWRRTHLTCDQHRSFLPHPPCHRSARMDPLPDNFRNA